MTTGISWTDITGGVRGCSRTCASGTKQSGCGDPTGGGCYAERMAYRITMMDRARGVPEGEGHYDGLVRMTPTGPRWTGVVRFDYDFLARMTSRRKPARVFPSMGDPFHESLTNEQIAVAFALMAAAPQHTFQVLTKRAARMRDWFEWVDERAVDGLAMFPDDPPSWRIGQMLAVTARKAIGFDGQRPGTKATGWESFDPRRQPWPLPNVWLGVSVEHQLAADERIPELLETPAAVRFISAEPLLGDTSIWAYLRGALRDESLAKLGGNPNLPGLDLVIAGCESGPGARPCSVEWLMSLRDECAAAGVAFWLKQAVEGGGITAGAGSKRKSGSVIELPYLDGLQHMEMPRV
jgi:protein gp37